MIFINNSNIKKQLFPTNIFIYNICKLAINKIIFKNEIIFHYINVILNANENYNNILIKKPNITFEDFIPMESCLDNKIKHLFVRGAMFILDNNNWNKYKDLVNFREEFIKINKFNEKDELNIEKIKGENNLIEVLISELDINKKVIELNIRNSCFEFKKMYEDNEEEYYYFNAERLNKSRPPYQKLPMKENSNIINNKE